MTKKQKEYVLMFMRLAMRQIHPEFNPTKQPYNEMLQVYYDYGDESEELERYNIIDRQALFMYIAIKGLEEA
jgi:hypothetical protein